MWMPVPDNTYHLCPWRTAFQALVPRGSMWMPVPDLAGPITNHLKKELHYQTPSLTLIWLVIYGCYSNADRYYGIIQSINEQCKRLSISMQRNKIIFNGFKYDFGWYMKDHCRSNRTWNVVCVVFFVLFTILRFNMEHGHLNCFAYTCVKLHTIQQIYEYCYNSIEIAQPVPCSEHRPIRRSSFFTGKLE